MIFCCCTGSFFLMNFPATNLSELFMFQDTYTVSGTRNLDSKLRPAFESIGIKTYDDWCSRFDSFPIFQSHSIGSGSFKHSDIPDLIKEAYGIDVKSHPFFAVKPEPYTLLGITVDVFTRFDYQFFPALIALLLGAPNPYKAGKKLTIFDELTHNSSGILPFESSFFLSPLNYSNFPRHTIGYPTRETPLGFADVPTYLRGVPSSSYFFPFSPVSFNNSFPSLTQVVIRNGKKYFPFRIIPRFSVPPYRQPLYFIQNLFYRFFDMSPSPFFKSITYENYLLHPYGIVYCDEDFVLSRPEFFLPSFWAGLDGDGYALGSLYDPFRTVAHSPTIQSSVRFAHSQSLVFSPHSLSISDYLSRPFEPNQIPQILFS